MSPYAVVLTTEAEDSLVDAWLDAGDRQAITKAEAAIHDLLRSDPIGKGTPIAEGLFRIAYGQLVAYYCVDDAQKVVEVSRFWRPS